MSWTYVWLRKLDSMIFRYEMDLRRQRNRARDDASAQKAINDLMDWRDFLIYVLAFEDRKQDPKDFLPVERQHASPEPSLYRAHRKPYNIVYDRDAETETVVGILMYRDGDRDKMLNNTFF